MLSIAPRGHSYPRDDQWYVVFCFAEREDADPFRVTSMIFLISVIVESLLRDIRGAPRASRSNNCFWFGLKVHVLKELAAWLLLPAVVA